MDQKPIRKMLAIGGYYVHPAETIVTEPFKVELETKSPNFNPKLAKFYPMYSNTEWTILIKLQYC